MGANVPKTQNQYSLIRWIEKNSSRVSGADLGGGCRECAEMTYWLLKFVYLTSQLRHSLVVHPLISKNPGSAPEFYYSGSFKTPDELTLPFLVNAR